MYDALTSEIFRLYERQGERERNVSNYQNESYRGIQHSSKLNQNKERNMPTPPSQNYSPREEHNATENPLPYERSQSNVNQNIERNQPQNQYNGNKYEQYVPRANQTTDMNKSTHFQQQNNYNRSDRYICQNALPKQYSTHETSTHQSSNLNPCQLRERNTSTQHSQKNYQPDGRQDYSDGHNYYRRYGAPNELPYRSQGKENHRQERYDTRHQNDMVYNRKNQNHRYSRQIETSNQISENVNTQNERINCNYQGPSQQQERYRNDRNDQTRTQNEMRYDRRSNIICKYFIRNNCLLKEHCPYKHPHVNQQP